MFSRVNLLISNKKTSKKTFISLEIVIQTAEKVYITLKSRIVLVSVQIKHILWIPSCWPADRKHSHNCHRSGQTQRLPGPRACWRAVGGFLLVTLDGASTLSHLHFHKQKWNSRLAGSKDVQFWRKSPGHDVKHRCASADGTWIIRSLTNKQGACSAQMIATKVLSSFL